MTSSSESTTGCLLDLSLGQAAGVRLGNDWRGRIHGQQLSDAKTAVFRWRSSHPAP